MLAHEPLVLYDEREEENEEEEEKDSQDEEEGDEARPPPPAPPLPPQQPASSPLPQPLGSCRTTSSLRSVAPGPQYGDVQRGRVQSGTTGGEASQHEQQLQQQQQQREKDEKSQQVWRNGQQHHVQRGEGVVTDM